MRNWILVLILINVLAFAYQKWILEPERSVAADYIAQDYPGLEPVGGPPPVADTGEPETTPQVADEAPVEPPEESAPQASVLRCLKAGAYPNRDDADVVAGRLGDLGAKVRITSAETRARTGFWVQAVGYRTRADARAARVR